VKRLACIGVAVAAVTTGALGQEGRRAPAPGAAQARALLDGYCTGCHSTAVRAGGVALDALSLDAPHEHAEIWEAALRKLRGRQMPPPGSRQPARAEIDAFVGWMEAELDRTSDGPTAGHVPIQRLTRTEFETAVNGLLGVEIDGAQLLPAEIEVDGFDNVAAALSVSPAFLDQYVAASRLAARLAVGAGAPKPASAFYPLPEGDQPEGIAIDGGEGRWAQEAHVDGLPLGTRGGMAFRHHFPADGEYRFTFLDLGGPEYSYAFETRHTLVLLIDGREVFREALGGLDDLAVVEQAGASGLAEVMRRFTDIPVQVAAGTHDVVATFIERARVESDGFIPIVPGDAFSRGPRMPRLRDGVTVVGPFDAAGVSRTRSRERIFVCRPSTGSGQAGAEQERACARRIAGHLARRAFRRPVTAGDVDPLMAFFDAGSRGGGGFDGGIEQVVAAVLVSPDFLYRGIQGPAGAADRDVFPLTDLELATRLSFFLWSQGPDDALLDLAVAGALRDPAVLQAQALRMLDDPRASSLVRTFAVKWLDLDALAEAAPDPDLFPTFDEQLREDLRIEVEAFLESVLLGDRNVGELLTADYTFLNERLARHYGVPSVLGPQFRRVRIDDERRRGLLGKGAMLLRTSYGDRTSPVLRGAWVMDKLMGTPPTPPPPDVETDLASREGEPPTTLRARLERHRSSPSCSQCHGVIDPIGLALENFDAIGRWRDVDEDADAPIDARTRLPNGRTVNGPAEMRQAIFGDTDLFVRALTERLMMYAVGRELEYTDMPQVRAVVRRAAAEDFRLSAIVSGIVASDAFRLQATGESDERGE
jgi:mono/diheme cytochrome c family protein